MLLLTLWAAVVAVELESDKKKNQDKVFPSQTIILLIIAFFQIGLWPMQQCNVNPILFLFRLDILVKDKFLGVDSSIASYVCIYYLYAVGQMQALGLCFYNR